MAKQETNFFEMVLRSVMIGETIYNDKGVAITITNLNYDPLIQVVYISDGTDSYKLKVTQNFDFDYSNFDKIIPNQHKIMGKRSR